MERFGLIVPDCVLSALHVAMKVLTRHVAMSISQDSVCNVTTGLGYLSPSRPQGLIKREVCLVGAERWSESRSWSSEGESRCGLVH